MSEIKEVELLDAETALAAMDAMIADTAADCARCNGRGRVEVNTIAGRMLDACPDCTMPNNFF